jgi:hypothetical protein
VWGAVRYGPPNHWIDVIGWVLWLGVTGSMLQSAFWWRWGSDDESGDDA